MSTHSIPVTSCGCGVVIGKIKEEFNQRVSNGESRKDIMDALGLRTKCCRRTILSTNTFFLQPAQVGTVQPGVLNPVNTYKTFTLDKQTEETHRGPPVQTKDRAGIQTISPDEFQAIVGIEEPKNSIGHDHMLQGQYDIEGYSRDREGKIRSVQVGVGAGSRVYHIPILKVTKRF